MSNRRMSLSEEGKIILEQIMGSLEVERPLAVKISLAKGISCSDGEIIDEFVGGKNKWTIPDNIIKDKEFLLFKHLIINEAKKSLDDESLHKYMLSFIEKGLRVLKNELDEKTSIEDFRITIL
ncbi:hypothetical protein [Peribacillus simplex]|uniref:hypothetical protein n=1 Tax=Peribacillus simplex TaxID=1478 RepID=UPI003CE790B8